MSDAAVQSDQRAESTSRTWGVLGRILGFLLGSLIVSILLEWLGMYFLWPEQGINHSLNMIQIESGYLNEDFKNAIYGDTPGRVITSVVNDVYHVLFQMTGLENGIGWLGKKTGVGDYLWAIATMTQLYLIRVGILVFSLPVYVLFAVVGLTAGLTMRDIRRWSGGREYGRVYHKAKAYAPLTLILAWFVYLTYPDAVHPNALILPCAVLFGINLWIYAATFKKYY